jgi:transposase
MSTSMLQVERVQQRWNKARELKQYGWRAGAIATALEVATPVLNQWLKEYPATAQQRICTAKPLAPATTLNTEEQQRLYRLLQRLPSDFGFVEPQWTSAQVRMLIEQLFDISLEENALATTLQALTAPPPEHQNEQMLTGATLLSGQLKKHHRIRKLQLWALDHQSPAQPFIPEPPGSTIAEARSIQAAPLPDRREQGGLGKFKSGPPTKLTLEQLQTLPELLLKPPQAYGLTGAVWTYKQIALLIEQKYQVSFSLDYIPDFLKRARRRLEKLGRDLEHQQEYRST